MKVLGKMDYNTVKNALLFTEKDNCVIPMESKEYGIYGALYDLYFIDNDNEYIKQVKKYEFEDYQTADEQELVEVLTDPIFAEKIKGVIEKKKHIIEAINSYREECLELFNQAAKKFVEDNCEE